MREQVGCVVFAVIAVLTMGAPVAGAAPGDAAASAPVGPTQSRAAETNVLVDRSRTHGSRSSNAGFSVLAADGAAGRYGQPDASSPEQRSKKLRAEIKKIVDAARGVSPAAVKSIKTPEFKQQIRDAKGAEAEREAVKEAEGIAHIAPLSAEQERNQIKRIKERILEEKIDEAAKKEAAESVKRIERAERELVAPTEIPLTLEEQTELGKERAFQNYESEKASGNLRDLLDTVR